jgi:hypothetical protein
MERIFQKVSYTDAHVRTRPQWDLSPEWEPTPDLLSEKLTFNGGSCDGIDYDG